MTTRRFELHRDTDVTGVSGTGVVAEGMHFVEADICVLRWTSQTPTSVVFHEKGLASVEAVHGHGGSTRIVWLDSAAGAPLRVIDRALAAVAADDMKVAVCEYLLTLNRGEDRPFIPPTAINWIGDGIVTAILEAVGTDV